MSLEGGYYPDDICCKPALLALRAMNKIAYNEIAACNKCPFPFCIKDEARSIDRLSRSYLIRGMLELGDSVNIIASKLGISKRTIYRTEVPISKCHWCNIDSMQNNVFCRTRVSTVAFDRDKIVVVLSKHKHANKQECKLTEYLIENMFPDSILRAGNGSTHEHWEVANVSMEEAQKVYKNMDFLSKFTRVLR